MSITRAAIEKDRITYVALAVLLAAGVNAYLSMPQAEDPGFIVRTAAVTAFLPGASPERVEQLVTDKLEKAIQEIPELDFVSSQSKTGVSIIFVNIQERYKQMRPIWDDLRRKIERARNDLPDGVRGPFVNDEFGDVFGTLVTITGDGYSYAELKQVADEVRDELLLIREVAKVDIFGAQDERIFVEYNNARLADLGLSPLQLRNILESRNIINPGGDIRTDEEEIVFEPSGNFESLDDLRRTVVRVPGSDRLLQLQDIASIVRGYVDPPTSKVHVSGEPGLVLAISLRQGGNILALGDAVKKTIDRARAGYPIGVDFGYAAFQAGAVEKKVGNFLGNLVQAVVIVLAVMLLTLGVRTGLVVATLIPSAIIVSFIFMAAFDIGINQMSLASLIIALGLLVDNAIVMSESILVQMGEGVPVVEAAVRSAGELKIPLLTSSLTTAAAFLPIYLAESTTGEYTAPLFEVVTITLLCSWALSLTVIPLFCVRFLRAPKRAAGGGGYETPFYRRYRGFLLTLLQHRAITLIVVGGVFFSTLLLFRLVPVIFFPPNDRATLTAELRLPTGAPLAKTEKVVGEIESYLKNELQVSPQEAAAGREGVTDWASFIGQGGARFVLSYTPEPASPEYAILLINATSRREVDQVTARLREFCERFPGLKAKVDPLPLGPPSENPIEVRISGRDSDRVFDYVARVKDRLQEIAGTRSISDNWGARSKKVLVEIDEDRAQRAGVTNQDIALSLQTVFSGFATTEYREGDKVIPVTLRSEQARLEPGLVGSVNVFSQVTGRSVPVGQVADIELAWQPAKILRRNRLRTVTVQSDLEPGVTAAEVNAALTPWLVSESASWPLGYSWELGGEEENSTKANESIVEKLPIAGLLIVLLLVWQFNSIRRPLIILITIPLGVIGVTIGLVVMRSYFGFMTLLGIISLAGIVINNAIVLLDRIQIEISELGRTPQQAVVESVQRRLRPIILTTLTTLGGLVPLYLGGGPMYQPLAVAIMYGLLFATLLTLGVVPVLYSVFFRVSFAGYQYPAAGGAGITERG
jgi:multidrug efflux pump